MTNIFSLKGLRPLISALFVLAFTIFLFNTIESSSAEPKSAIDDLPIATVLRCTLDPTGPGCLACPPFCLNKPKQNFKYANETVLKRLEIFDIKVERSNNRVTLTRKGGRRVTLKCNTLRQPQHQIIACEGLAGNKNYTWKTTYPLDKQASRSGAIEFKHFLSTANAELDVDFKRLDPTPTKDEEGDEVFCNVLGILTGAANPIGGAAIFALCTWFASNGLDE